MKSQSDEPKGIIGKTVEKGFPVIWRFANELPSQSEREQLPWLTVVSWTYDGTTRNGMPPPELNQQMIILEDALRNLESPTRCRHAYSRTGNHLKEFVYYISNRDDFMALLNAALESHPRYPIAINFYEDKEWKDFCELLADFGDADKSDAQQPAQPDGPTG